MGILAAMGYSQLSSPSQLNLESRLDHWRACTESTDRLTAEGANFIGFEALRSRPAGAVRLDLLPPIGLGDRHKNLHAFLEYLSPELLIHQFSLRRTLSDYFPCWIYIIALLSVHSLLRIALERGRG